MIEKFCFYLKGLRKKDTSGTEIRRPMCWIAIGIVFLFVCLFWGRSYEEIPDFTEKQRIYLEGKIVSKEYKTSAYAAYWQIVLKEVKTDFDTGGTVSLLEGKYLCQLEGTEKNVPKIGQQILLTAMYKPWKEVSNPGQFDTKKWYCSQGILGGFNKGKILKQGEKFSLLKEEMWKFRNRLQECLQQELGEKLGALLTAMVLGDKNGLEEESKNLYQRTGVSHVLSISGLHLSILGMGLFTILKQIFGNRKIVVVFCMVVMVLYCIFTGNSVSTIRATIMFIVSLGAQIMGRSYDSLSALGLAAILQLILNPYALNNSSFLLSFLAVVGVTFISPRLQKILGVKNNIAKSFCVSLSATLATLPVLLKDYGTYPWYSIILNLFIVPVMSVLLFLSILLLFFIFLGLYQSYKIKIVVILFRGLKNIIIFLIKLILNYMEICCEFFDKLPFQDGYLGCPGIWQIFFYVILLYLGLSNVWKHTIFCKKILLLSAVMLLTLSVHFGTEIVMLDVGQGDSVVIHNSNGNVYISDCGSSSVNKVGKYRLLPFLKYKGYGKIKGVFLSHLDEDHINGIMELLEMALEEKIKLVYLFLPESVLGMQEDREQIVRLEDLAQQNRTKIVYLRQGDRIKDGDMEFLCLYPKRVAEQKHKEDNRNNQSLVLYMKYRDLSLLLTGDVEKEGEKEILKYVDQISLNLENHGNKDKSLDRRKENRNDFQSLNVLKVAHHGSSGSTGEEFLETFRPGLGLLSCGKNNSYGHPHKETIERLEKTGTQILSTVDSGAITLKIERKRVKIECYKKNQRQKDE